MTDYVRDVARRACVEAGQAPAEGDWELDDFFAYAAGRMVKGSHVAVFEATARVRQSGRERSGPREGLVGIVASLIGPVAQAAERLAAIEPGLMRYLRTIEACDNVATPEGRTLLTFGDEKRVPGGTERAAATRELIALFKRAAELVPSVARGLDECRPDILRANMLTDTKGERAG